MKLRVRAPRAVAYGEEVILENSWEEQPKRKRMALALQRTVDKAPVVTAPVGTVPVNKAPVPLVPHFAPKPQPQPRKVEIEAAEESEEVLDVTPQRAQNIRQNFTCPVSQALMEYPMMSGTCIHRVNIDSVISCAKGTGECNCPVYGCNAIWRLGTITVDVDLQRRIRQYKESGEANNHERPSTQEVIEIN